VSSANGSNNHDLVDLRSVYKRFETGAVSIPVLEDVSLRIGEGEFVGVVGPPDLWRGVGRRPAVERHGRGRARQSISHSPRRPARVVSL